jgi:hypothetical protein
VERARATWTDERLDDLSRRVDDGFDRVEARLDGLQRTMIQIGGGTIVTVLATLASVIVIRA